MTGKTLMIGDFLTERKERMTPDEANISGIPRLEKIDFSGTIHIREGKGTNTGMILVYPGDLVISGINVEKGALAVFEGNCPILATIHYSSYLYNPEIIDIEYLRYFTRSLTFRKIILEQVGGGIKTEIKPKKFLSLKISVPSLIEQKEIINKIKGVENEINEINEINTKNVSLSGKLKLSIFQDAVKGKLVPQNQSDESASILIEKIQIEKIKLTAEGKLKKQKTLPPITPENIPHELPNGWRWVRLGEVASFLNGYAFKSEGFSKKGVKLVRNTNVGIGKLVWEDVAYIPKEEVNNFEEYLLNLDDLVISLDRPIIKGGLKVALITNNDLPCLLLQRVLKITPILLSKGYLFIWINSPFFLNTINPGKSMGIPHISHNDISNLPFPMPPIKEQIRIVEKLNELMKSCELLNEQVKQAKERSEKLMESVLQGVFNG